MIASRHGLKGETRLVPARHTAAYPPTMEPAEVRTIPRWLQWTGSLLLAPASVALALVVSLSLAPWLSDATFMPFFIAILASAWAGRLWTGLAAIALSNLACAWFLFD